VEKLTEYDSLMKALAGNRNIFIILCAKLQCSNCPDNIKISSSSYWTSGSDSGCPGKHAWCSASQVFREGKWSSTASNDSSKNCVAISMSRSSAELLKENCAIQMEFICEVFFEIYSYKD